MGSLAGLDGCGKPHPNQDSIPGTSSPERVALPIEISLSAVVFEFLYNFWITFADIFQIKYYFRSDRTDIGSSSMTNVCKQIFKISAPITGEEFPPTTR
jgi:hypothetical protein